MENNSTNVCPHNNIDIHSVCLDCGECNVIDTTVKIILPTRKTLSNTDRKILHFRDIMDKKSGKQSLPIKQKTLDLIEKVAIHFNPNYDKECVKYVLKKLKLRKFINSYYLIYCILKKEPLLDFSVYKDYFEYLYIKLTDEYSKIHPYKYFITAHFVLSKFLNEVGIDDKYYFKNIITFEIQNTTYNIIRNLENVKNITYKNYSLSP